MTDLNSRMNHSKRILELINQLESRQSNLDLINQRISTSTVGWQIEHSLLTINKIIEALKKSDPKAYKWKFSFPRLVLFIMNKIPRGRAASPKIVQPKSIINQETLYNHFIQTKENIKLLDTLNKSSFFYHPYFGNLNLKQTLNFLEIHTKHHLQIIDDIYSGKKLAND